MSHSLQSKKHKKRRRLTRVSPTSVEVEFQTTRQWRTYAKRLLPVLVVTLLPVTQDLALWGNVMEGARARAWDGTGHFALAQLYSQTIFPDTFGWTHAYFAGMPFPNFYPPLFYWCVALLSHTQLLSFAAAFKLVLVTPVILLPAAVWILAWSVSCKDRTVATAAAIAILPMLVDYRLFHPVGLTHPGTFLIGLYSQPLGFVLLIAWYLLYMKLEQRVWRFILTSILLALTILSNFFSAITAAFLVTATLLEDAVRFYQSTNQADRRQWQSSAFFHLGSPMVSLCLTLFWLVPMAMEYAYFVTRPQASPFNELVPHAMWVWYAVAVLGIWQWIKRPTASTRPFLFTCFILAGSVIFASTVAPRWFPLQTPRFLSTLNFLLAVPVGFAIRAGLSRLALAVREDFWGEKRILSRRERRLAARGGNIRTAWLGAFFRTPITSSVAVVLVIVLLIFIEPANYAYVFYKSQSNEEIDGVLRFAQAHRDGRYLVEVPIISRPDAALDGRALNSFLGAQGNEALSVVFREASPSSIFFNPLASAFAESPDNFGISTVLADDLDFVQQPLERHIDRARFVGVRYLVIATLWIKNYLIREDAVGPRHDFGVWSVFELRERPPEKVRALAYKPALVLSSFSLKERWSSEHDFVRWAEEQFNDDWFDVLLVRSLQSKIDRLDDLDNFGALILDTYDYDDENTAFDRLRDLARKRSLILLSTENRLFQRILEKRNDFPLLQVVHRQTSASGHPLSALKPANHYGSSPIREEWKTIRRILESGKIPTNTESGKLSHEISQSSIRLDFQRAKDGEAIPILVATTFHPNWRRSDGGAVYSATPFFMLTFVDKSVSLTYRRGWFERLALWMSATSLLFLCGFIGWHSWGFAKNLKFGRQAASPDRGFERIDCD